MLFHTANLLCRYAAGFSKSRIKDAGLTYTEHLICSMLWGHGSLSQEEMASKLVMDKTTLAKALAVLEKNALVSREINPENRRKNVVGLTPEGRRRISPTLEVYDRWSENMTGCLTPAESALLDDISAKLLHQAKLINKEAQH